LKHLPMLKRMEAHTYMYPQSDQDNDQDQSSIKGLESLAPGQRVSVGVQEQDTMVWLSGRVTVAATPSQPWVGVQCSLDWPGAPKLKKGQRLVLSVGRPGDGYYSVEARLEAIVGGPEAELRLRALGPWQRLQRRQDRRLPVFIPARSATRLEADGQRRRLGPTQVVEVSPRGLRVRSEEELTVGDRLLLAFALPDDEAELRVGVEVRHARLVGTDGAPSWEAGVRFQVLRQLDQDRLRAYVSTSL
jgi:hypothetical protein